MKAETQDQILNETVCILLCTNALEKGMNPSVLPWPSRLGSLA